MDFYDGALVSGVCKMEKGYSVTVVVCGVLLFLHFTTAVGHFSGVSASSAAMLQYNMLQYTMAALLALQLLPDPLP